MNFISVEETEASSLEERRIHSNVQISVSCKDTFDSYQWSVQETWTSDLGRLLEGRYYIHQWRVGDREYLNITIIISCSKKRGFRWTCNLHSEKNGSWPKKCAGNNNHRKPHSTHLQTFKSWATDEKIKYLINFFFVVTVTLQWLPWRSLQWNEK